MGTKTSQFHYACRNGDVAKVKMFLMSVSTKEIDRMEPNGSTALHAAAYFGHIDIVRLLLEKGASSNQKNKYGNTPEEEARNPEIAQLFQDIKVKPDIDWSISNVFAATSQHRRFYSFNQGPPTLSYVVDKLLTAKELWSTEKLDTHTNNQMAQVRKLFQDAVKKHDAVPLLCAYTLQSSFYLLMDKTLASHNELTNEERQNPPCFCAFARFLANDEPTLRPYRWTGTAYRGDSISEYDLVQLQVGKMLMNKAFLLASHVLEVAKGEASVAGRRQNKRGAIFKYIVNDDRAAFHITTISAYPLEDSILILPCMDFQITEIKDNGVLIEITLLLR